jgi:hypothetical protein
MGKFLISYFSGLSASVEMNALASAYESQRYCEAGGRMGEACCVDLLLLEWLNE